MINKKKFYNEVRSTVFGKLLTQRNCDGMDAIINAWERDYLAMDSRYLAYVLATVFEETDGTMAWDIEEKYNGNAKDYFAKYDGRANLGNTEAGDGYKFRGRSFCQVTGRRNYAWASTITGVDLVADPDKIKQKDIAVKVLLQGMVTGHFTGHKLADYFKSPQTDREYLLQQAVDARHIINGQDQADKIARYFMSFWNAIVASQEVDEATTVVIPTAGPVPAAIVAPVSTPMIGGTDANGNNDPVDRGKPLYKSLTAAGGTLTAVFGSVGTLSGTMSSFSGLASWQSVVALVAFLLIILGFVLVIIGRKRIQYEAGY